MKQGAIYDKIVADPKGRRRGMEKKTYFISYTNRTEMDKQWAVWAEWFFRVRMGGKTIM